MKHLLRRFISGLRSQSKSEQLPRLAEPARVAARALVLASLVARGQLERHIDRNQSASDTHKLEEDRRDIVWWFEYLSLADEIEDGEDRVLRTPVGRLQQSETIDAVWRGEELAFLAWSLGRADLPRYDEFCDSFDIAKRLGFVRARSETVLAAPALRPRSELIHWSHVHLTVNWRLKQFSIVPESMDFADYLSRSDWSPPTLTGLDFIDGDLAIRGVRIDRVPQEWRDETLSIVRARRKGFEWLFELSDADSTRARGKAAAAPRGAPPATVGDQPASESSALRQQNLAPPDAARVAARALVLTAVTARGHLERDDDRPHAAENHGMLCQWLDGLGIADEIEADEHALIRAALGSLEQQAMVDAMWRGEAIVALAWSLGCAGLPRYDETCDSMYVARLLGFMRERSMTALARPSLRPSTEIAHWANTYLTLHWRLRQFSISKDRIPFADYVAWARWGPLTVAELDLIDGDLAVQGERIERLSEDRYHLSTSIARERHKAFNWLLGHHPIYSEVRTPT
jgi:hypothetical protein